MIPRSMYAILNRNIMVPYSIAWEVFVKQYYFKEDDAKKAGIISKLSCPFIDLDTFIHILKQYPNNYGWTLKSSLLGPDELAKLLEKNDKNDKSPIKKHEPLDETETEPKNESQEVKSQENEPKEESNETHHKLPKEVYDC